MKMTDEFIIEQYITNNKSVSHIAEEYGLSKYSVIKIVNRLQLSKSKDAVSDSKRTYCIWKYGVDSPTKLQEIIDKTKNTNLKIYGATNPSKSKLIKTKISNSIKEFYSNDDNKSCAIEKRKKTCIEKYGTEHHLKSNYIVEKRNKTNTDRYGGNSPACNKDVLAKRPKPSKERIEKQKETYRKNLLAGKYDNIVRSRRSAGENEIRDWLLSLNLAVQQGNRSLLSGKEIDLYLPEHKLGIEYNGLFWHSDSDSANGISNDYHCKKYEQAKSCGVRLLTIWDKEWEENKDVVKSYILSVLNIFEKKIFARNCTFKIIDNNVANEFCDRHHFQGKTIRIKHSFCLLHNDEVVSVITFGYHHRKNTNELVLSRYCVKSGYCIIGGAEKLFINSMKTLGTSEVISWSDNRISYGRVYEKLGFELDAKLKADYFYIKSDGRTIIPKQSMQKKKCGCPDNMTEREYCKNVLKLNRVYDCGKIRWKWTQKKTPD